jgi:hypothetical protein
LNRHTNDQRHQQGRWPRVRETQRDQHKAHFVRLPREDMTLNGSDATVPRRSPPTRGGQ